MTHPYATAHVEVELDWNNLEARFEAGVKAAVDKASKVVRQNYDRVAAASSSDGLEKAARRMQTTAAAAAKDAARSTDTITSSNREAEKAAEDLAEATGKVRAEQAKYDELVAKSAATKEQLVDASQRLDKAVRDEAAAHKEAAAAIGVANAKRDEAARSQQRLINIQRAAEESQRRTSASQKTNPDQFQRGLLDRVKQVGQQAEVGIPLTVDGERLRRQIRDQVAAATATVSAEIPVDLELGAAARAKALAEVERLERELGRPVEKEVHVHVDRSGGGSERGGAPREREAAGGASRSVRVDAEDGGGIARLGSSIEGVIGSAGRLAVVGAATAAIGGAAGAAAGLVGVLGVGLLSLGVAGAAGVAATVVGLHGVMDTLKAYSAADDSASKDAEAKSKAIAAATKEEEVAEKDVRNAKRESRDAEKDLTTARTDALRTLRDLNRELAGAALTEKDAQLAVLEAKRDLIKLPQTNPTADAIDREKAVLRVETAEQRLKEVQDKNQDLAAKTISANKKGVEQSDVVVKAQQKVTKANENTAEANKKLADAHTALTDAQKKTSDSADKAAQKLAKLAPSAQATVLAIRANKSELEAFDKSVQGALFNGLDVQVNNLVRNTLPTIQTGMTGVAGSINFAAKSFSEFFQTPAAKRGLSDFFGGAGDFIKTIQPGLAGFTQGLLDIATAARPVMGQLGQAFGGLLSNIGQAFSEANKSGALTQLFATFGTVIRGLGEGLKPLISGLIQIGNIVGPTLGPLFKALGVAFQAVAPALGLLGAAFATTLTALMPQLSSFISALATGLAPVLPIVGQLLGVLLDAARPLIGPFSQILMVLGPALVSAVQALAPSIGPLGTAFAALITAVAPLLPAIAEIVSGLIQALAPALTTIFQAAAPLISQFVSEMMPVFRELAPVIAQVAGQVGQALAAAIVQLAPLIPPMVTAFSNLIIAIIPLLPQLVQLSIGLLPPVIGLLIQFTPVLLKLIDAFTWLVSNVIVPFVIPAMKDLAGIFETTMRTASDAVTTSRHLIGDAVTDIGGVFSGLGNTVSTIWDGIVRAIAIAVKAIGEILQKVKIPDWVPGLGGKGMSGLGDSMVGWATAHGAARGGFATASGITRMASGGRAISGPGSGTSDSIPAMLGNKPLAVSNGEFISTAAAYQAGAPLLWALNRGWVPPPELLQMLVHGVPGFASGGPVDARSEQDKIADAIVAEGRREGISDKGIKIALAVGIAESGLRILANPNDPPSLNYPHSGLGYDHTSSGVFQQQNNGGWGTSAQRMDPTQSAALFYHALKQTDYQAMSPAAAAQKVQGSAFSDGSNYASQLAQADKIFAASIGRQGAGAPPATPAPATPGSGDGQRVFVTNWPGGLDLGATARAATGATTGTGVPGAGLPPIPTTGQVAITTVPGMTAAPGSLDLTPKTGIDAANQWAGQQDFQSQAQNWGFDSLKSIVGEFADIFGLKKLSGQGLDQARQALTTIKVADTVNYYGVNDPNKIADSNARMLRDRMTPVSETYRNG